MPRRARFALVVVLVLLAVLATAAASSFAEISTPGTSTRWSSTVTTSTSATSASPAKPRAFVTVTAEGGLCRTTACRWSGRITTATISATGSRSRPITGPERRELARAIAALDPASLPRFEGTCPIAYDGLERIYRFTGTQVLRSCTYDLRGVRAVRLADRLLASLKPQ